MKPVNRTNHSPAQRDDARIAGFLVQGHVNPIKLASRYLKKPVWNSITYTITSFLAALPFISRRLRRSLLRSAAKRDKKWLSARVLDANRALVTGEAFDFLGTAQFDPFRGKDRQHVAGSDWHVALSRLLSEHDIDMDALPTISVSFVTFNSARWLPGLIETLLDQGYPASRLNLYFIDNGSKDDTVSLIEDFRQQHGAAFASVTLHQQDNVGFGMGHDYAIRNSTDDFVLISNVDLRFHPRSLLDIVRVAEADDTDVASWELRQCPYEHPKYYDPVTLETLWSSYACILLRRSAYLDVGGFEERIFMYGEDVELSYRFRGAGYRLRYLPQVPVTHFVDFEDTTLRPHQLTGSVAANLLLRYRYGDAQSAENGELLLASSLINETDKNRLSALGAAKAQVKRDREHFETTRRPQYNVEFPFNVFDYDITRRGHDVPLDSTVPLDGPLVSIVTRTFGPNTSLLREAIASVCNQTYRRIEHLIVEDRTDFAGSLVSDLQSAYGRNIRYIRSMAGGRSPAGNMGLAQSRGELLMFLDNDDLLLADHVEILVRALLAHPEAPAAYSLAWEIPTFYDQNGRYREGVPIHLPSQAVDFDTSLLKKGNFMPIQNVLFRRSLFETYGGFDPEIDHLEDWNLWCRYSQDGKFTYIPKTTAMYRVPGDQVFLRSRTKVMVDAEEAVRAKNNLCFQQPES